MGLQKGMTNNPGGRPKGSKNKSTSEIRELIDDVIDIKELIGELWGLTQSNLMSDASPQTRLKAMELILAYRYGKPTQEASGNDEQLNINPKGYSDEEKPLTLEDLEEMKKEIVRRDKVSQ